MSEDENGKPFDPTRTRCPLCLGTGDDPFLTRMEMTFAGAQEVDDYCRLCEGDKVVGPDEVFRLLDNHEKIAFTLIDNIGEVLDERQGADAIDKLSRIRKLMGRP